MYQVRINSSSGCSTRAPTSAHGGARVRVAGLQRHSRSVRPSVHVQSAKFETVEDAMTTGEIHTCLPETPVEAALQMLVDKRITGLPVVNKDGKVVGVVSDFDLLALDSIGRVNKDNNLFPEADQTWQAFKDVKKLVAKSGRKKVEDVMTKELLICRPGDSLEAAVRLLLTKGIRRLPVLDDEGNLVGIISRSNIVKAALMARQASSSVASADGDQAP